MIEAGKPTFQYISPDRLRFDPDNPRFSGQLRGKSQPEIQQTIFGAPHYASELVNSFVENGFIGYEPLVAKTHGDEFVVIEGNRRLAAIKEIRANPSKYAGRKDDLDKIPVIVFPNRDNGAHDNEVRVYLGLRHLLGFRDWPPLAKAEFLDKESQKPGGLEAVIKEVRLSRQEVRRFLIPYRLLNDAKINLPPGEDFWVLGEALGRTGVKKFLQLDIESKTLRILGYDKANLKLVLDDLYGTRAAGLKQRDAGARKVRDTRELSTYASVLASEKASAVLHGGKGLTEAAIYVDTREQSQAKLSKVVNDLGVLVRKLMQQEKSGEAVSVRHALKELDSAVKSYLKKHAKTNI